MARLLIFPDEKHPYEHNIMKIHDPELARILAPEWIDHKATEKPNTETTSSPTGNVAKDNLISESTTKISRPYRTWPKNPNAYIP